MQQAASFFSCAKLCCSHLTMNPILWRAPSSVGRLRSKDSKVQLVLWRRSDRIRASVFIEATRILQWAPGRVSMSVMCRDGETPPKRNSDTVTQWSSGCIRKMQKGPQVGTNISVSTGKSGPISSKPRICHSSRLLKDQVSLPQHATAQILFQSQRIFRVYSRSPREVFGLYGHLWMHNHD